MLLAAYLALIGVTPRFGGEDPLAKAGTTWHHENLTREAAELAGWEGLSIDSLAFHADYVDSYLYNPLWWIEGGLDRTKAAIATAPELEKVHFDDLFAPEKVHSMWRRYLSGTVAGLLWATREPADRRVSLAHNIIGVGLHAIQDFYSHSNWIDDPDRRRTTWFSFNRRDRKALSLWTAYYELPAQLGVKPHGKLLPLCKLFESAAVKEVMRVVCHAASPLSKSAACDMFERCRGAVPAQPRTVRGVHLPPNVGYYEEGIAVDSKWQAGIGAEVRDLGVSGDELFRTAYSLALQTSSQWLRELERIMRGKSKRERMFWSQVKSEGKKYKRDTEPFEKFDQLPYAFLSAGPYPPPNRETGREWWVRATITTSSQAGAGTDADIHLVLDGVDFDVLDYSPRANPVVGWSDFEAGDVASYMVGPLPTPPTVLALRNDAPRTLDVLTALGRDLARALVTAVESVGDFALSVLGGHADFIASDKWVMEAADLEALAVGDALRGTVDLRHHSEGHYRVSASVNATGTEGTDDLGVPWREFRVTVHALTCVKESDWDRGSNSDEPFLCYLVIPHGGSDEMQSDLAGPFADVDSGNSRSIDASYELRIPRRFGFISLACSVFESDDEATRTRRRLLREFADHVRSRTSAAQKTFAVTLGEALGSAWRPERVQLVAFSRSSEARVCFYRDVRPNRWISGRERYQTTLTKADEVSAAVTEPGEVLVEYLLEPSKPPIKPFR